jgi:serine/threonine-protein kinase
MAEIYLARMAGSDGFSKLVVIKRLLFEMAKDPEFVQMFLDEARINARLSHSNIVQVLELGEVDGQYFIAMEYVSGLSVAQVGKLATQRLGEVPQGVACGIVAQACAGLHHAHETTLPDGSNMGIIHRDVTPQNLILTYEGFVKVVDFGIAKAEGRATRTRAGVVKGKFAYMSPEQCTGGTIDRRTDIFALGIILFELCTARRLFKRANTFETYEAIIKCEVPDPSSVNPAVSPKVAQVIQKALAKKPDDRFATAEAMQEALELAMRRSQVRGSAMDLARFIENNFKDQIKEQEDLIRRIEAGELSQGEHQRDAEASRIAENYAALSENDIEEADEEEPAEGPTKQDGTSPAAKKPLPPPPAVPSLQKQAAPLPNMPVSMALPVINAKKALEDMLTGKSPNLLGDKLEGLARAANIQVPAKDPGSPTSGQGTAPTPARPMTGQGFAARPPTGQAMAPPSGMVPALTPSSPPPSSPSSSLSSDTPMRPGSAAGPMGALDKLANLPLPALLGIGVVIAILSALLTALLIW